MRSALLPLLVISSLKGLPAGGAEGRDPFYLPVNERVKSSKGSGYAGGLGLVETAKKKTCHPTVHL